MDYNTIYVGMDVHKENFLLCCYSVKTEKVAHTQKVQAECGMVLAYLDSMRKVYGDNVEFVCGYEAGCLGYTLYRQLTARNVKCVILAPTTMMEERGKRKVKTDKRDAALIARCLAYRTYKPVHVPTEDEEQVKGYLRMRDDHKIALKKVKQQILAFCLAHGFIYHGSKNHWTLAHLKWLRTLSPEGLYAEELAEYLATYDYLTDKLERMDRRIEELAGSEKYAAVVKKLGCFLGIKAHTALSIIVETGDFHRFPSADCFASYLGLTPGEHTSDANQTRLGITKAGNAHVRTLLIESAQSFSHGKPGHKSKDLKERQYGCSPEEIAYADKANERLRRKYYKMVLHNGKKGNVAKTAVARELACFIWGMMTGHVA